MTRFVHKTNILKNILIKLNIFLGFAFIIDGWWCWAEFDRSHKHDFHGPPLEPSITSPSGGPHLSYWARKGCFNLQVSQKLLLREYIQIEQLIYYAFNVVTG